MGDRRDGRVRQGRRARRHLLGAPPRMDAAAAVATGLWQALAVVLVADVLILGHELGHHLAARALGIPVRRFAVGFGPALARRTDRRGTEWRLGAFPLGGYVEFVPAAEADAGGAARGEGGAAVAYDRRGPLARLAVVAAGPAASALLAVLAFAVLLGAQGKPAFLPVADEVTAGGPAEAAGFRRGDRVIAVDGRPVETFEDLRPTLRAAAGRPLAFDVERRAGGGTEGSASPARVEVVRLVATPAAVEEGGRPVGLLGIRSTTLVHLAYDPAELLEASVGRAWGAARDTVVGIAGLVRHGEGRENIAGPIGVAIVAGDAAAAGWPTLLALAGILSANIALMNLLPLPVLDGGQMLLLLSEAATGRTLSVQGRDVALRLSVAVLLALLALTTLNDLHGLLAPGPSSGGP